MKIRIQLSVVALFLAVMSAGCPPPKILRPTGTDAEILDQLRARRAAMSAVETDVKFSFSPGAFMTTSLDGHAAYQSDSGKANVRVVAVGPLGALSMDLLIRNGDFRVRLPGYDKPLSQSDLFAIYGNAAAIRTPAILARLPGLFFGGIPDGIGEGWYFEDSREGRWLISPDDKQTKFLVEGNPAVIRRVSVTETETGTLLIDLDQFENTPYGPSPSQLTVRLKGRELFSVRLTNTQFGVSLPESVFRMEGIDGEFGL